MTEVQRNDKDGFDTEDYRHIADLIVLALQDSKRLSAIMCNNFNIILSALMIAEKYARYTERDNG